MIMTMKTEAKLVKGSNSPIICRPASKKAGRPVLISDWLIFALGVWRACSVSLPRPPLPFV